MGINSESLDDLVKRLENEENSKKNNKLDKILELAIENPEVAVTVVKMLIGQYKPMLYDLLGELYGVYKDYVNNQEIYKTVALREKNRLVAFIDAGFTREEAFDLMLNNDLKLQRSIERTKVNQK